MDNLRDALVLLRSGSIGGEQTKVIDTALITACPEDIPEADMLLVIDYINAELVHNPVDADVAAGLDRLLIQLENDMKV